MGKTKSKIKKKKRRLEQKAIQNGTAKKNKKATPFEIAAQYYSTIRGGVCEISLVKRLPRTR
ncbi:hypothetical protein ACN6KK_10975 [Enterococcus faecium]